jgi:hypothetical protein
LYDYHDASKRDRKKTNIEAHIILARVRKGKE